MRAVRVERKQGKTSLVVREVERPVAGPGEILIRVRASTVCQGDVNLIKIPRAILVPLGLVFGFKPMDVPGVEFAGVVETVGPGVTRFAPGDEVMGTATGLSRGGNAEYVVVPQQSRQGVLARKPAELGFEEAAALPVGGMTALQLLDRLRLKAGDKVLVYGVSGSVGTAAVQLGAARGLVVTAVCSAANADLVSGLGAKRVLDYRLADWEAQAGRFAGILDAVGRLKPRARKIMLVPGGRHINTWAPTSERHENLETLAELARQGLFKPVVDRVYPLDEVAIAHAYVQTGRKRGNVVLSV